MATGRAATFEENRPTLSEEEALEAAQRKAFVSSFSAFPVADETGKVTFLAVKVVLENGDVKTALFDPFSCVALCTVIERLSKGQWMIHRTSPSSGHTRQ
jgi:hypothetical protein